MHIDHPPAPEACGRATWPCSPTARAPTASTTSPTPQRATVAPAARYSVLLAPIPFHEFTAQGQHADTVSRRGNSRAARSSLRCTSAPFCIAGASTPGWSSGFCHVRTSLLSQCVSLSSMPAAGMPQTIQVNPAHGTVNDPGPHLLQALRSL